VFSLVITQAHSGAVILASCFMRLCVCGPAPRRSADSTEYTSECEALLSLFHSITEGSPADSGEVELKLLVHSSQVGTVQSPARLC
jgi:hypothetical protein